MTDQADPPRCEWPLVTLTRHYIRYYKYMGLVAPPVEVIQFDTRGRPFLFLKDQTAPRVTKLGYFGERVPKLVPR